MRGEKLMTLVQAAEWLSAELGIQRNRQSVYAWGYYGRSGIKLELVSVCGQWHTSREALRRFLAATTRAHSAESGARINELQV